MKKKLKSRKLVMPEHLNPAGYLFGGQLMLWMDKMTGMLAISETGKNCVTKAVTQFDFEIPVKLGDTLDLEAEIVNKGNTSITMETSAYKKHVTARLEEKGILVAKARFIFVALDADGNTTSDWRDR